MQGDHGGTRSIKSNSLLICPSVPYSGPDGQVIFELTLENIEVVDWIQVRSSAFQAKD